MAAAAFVGFGIGTIVPSLLGGEPTGMGARMRRVTLLGDPSGSIEPDEATPRLRSIEGTLHATRSQLMDAFEVGSPLAHGGTATVWSAVERATGRRVAIKVIDKSLVSASLISAELKAMRACAGDPNVVSLVAAYDVAADTLNPNGEWHLVMELAQGGEMLSWVQQHSRWMPECRFGDWAGVWLGSGCG